MISLFKKKPKFTLAPNEDSKLETCYTCGLPIKDNPHLELFFRDFQGELFLVHTHMNNLWKNFLEKNNWSIHVNTNNENCYDLVNIKQKLSYSTYIGTTPVSQYYKKK